MTPPDSMPRLLATVVTVGCALAATTAAAITVDGVLDPEYGTASSTQLTQTSMGDNFDFGAELDGAFAYLDSGTLHLMFTGWVNRWYSEFLVAPYELEIFIDVAPGGQNILSAVNPDVSDWLSLQDMAGLTFDDEFAADYWLEAGRSGSNAELWAYYAELPPGGGGAGYFLGRSPAGPPGALSGAGSFNPHGIRAAINLSPVAGVTPGCGPSSGAGVATGIEWAIPLEAIGNPTGQIRICALIASVRTGSLISNQVLGPVPPGTCDLGPPSGVDFGTIAGSQYFEFPPPVGVEPGPRGAPIGALVAWPNPFRGGTTLRFQLARDAEVAIEILDIGGRQVRGVALGRRSAGACEWMWDGCRDDGAIAPAGLYFAQAHAGVETLSGRIVRVR